ncbi:MAG: S41 family peptidase [Myxococcota bacterium]
MNWGSKLRSMSLAAVLCLGVPSAHAGVSEGAYGEVVRLVESLYLYPEEVDGPALLEAAAKGLADDLHWLVVTTDTGTVYLAHGDGTSIGSLSVATLQTLPEGLAALEDLVLASGHDVGDVDVRLSILQGVTRGLDRYSTVLSGERLSRFDVRLKGTLVGVGLTVNLVNDRLEIVSVVEAGPAQTGGVRPGDILVRIDGVSTVNMPIREASRRIRGQVASTVVLTVEREGRPLELSLKRAEIVVPNVDYRVLDGNVGYVHISHFSQRTDENLRAALLALQATDGMTGGLVIDLRQNTGGSMKDSARSADQFVHAGQLLRTAGADGGTVRNLQSRMQARSAGDEPDVPVVVLIDHRTASGSEIMAGALAGLDRAALLGRRSYGKGTVQKVYPIDPEARLKLTVARYLLAEDRGIDEDGLVPDVAVADVVLDGNGMRFHRFNAEDTGVDYGQVLPVVIERAGWRDAPLAQTDQRIEVARRAVLRTKGPRRQAIVQALESAAAEVRAEQLAHLQQALTAKGLDWSATQEPDPSAGAPSAEVVVSATAVRGEPGVFRVRSQVTNLDETVLEQSLVLLHSDSFPAWDGVAMPIGRLEPGEIGFGTYTVRLRPGFQPREDEVRVTLRASGRPVAHTGSTVLRSGSAGLPEIALTTRILPVSEPSSAANYRAEVTVHNLANVRLSAVEGSFDHPRNLDVELVTQAARIPAIPPRGSARMYLDLSVGADAPAALPLELTITVDDHAHTLAEWPVTVPVDGTAVALQAPQVQWRGPRILSAPTDRFEVPIDVSDETRLGHVVVYANGQKVGWAGGGFPKVSLSVPVDLRPGENVITVQAEDEHGVRTRRYFRVRGESEATADADEP